MDWKRILIGKWSWKRPIYSILSIYLLLVIIAIFFADRLIFFPPPSSYDKDLPNLTTLESSPEETTAVLHLKAAPEKPTLLFSHGNAEDLGDWLPVFEAWHSMGLGVIAYDYPGYGQSSGTPSEASCERSTKAVHQYLEFLGIPDSSVVIVGRSVGSGPSIWLASQMEAKALVLISPFTSAFQVAFPLPFPFLPRDRFPNLKRIRSIELPLLVIHGSEDEVTPASHGKSLADASPASLKSFLPIDGGGHNDLFHLHGDELIRRIAGFAENPAITDPSLPGPSTPGTD